MMLFLVSCQKLTTAGAPSDARHQKHATQQIKQAKTNTDRAIVGVCFGTTTENTQSTIER